MERGGRTLLVGFQAALPTLRGTNKWRSGVAIFFDNARSALVVTVVVWN